MKNRVPVLNGAGRFINDPTVRCSVGVINVGGKRTIAFGVHEAEVEPRIYPLSRADALNLADGLAKAAMAVDA